MLLLVVLLLALAAWLVVERANELFVLSVRGGRTILLRGHVPPRLQQEMSDVMRRARVQRSTIRVVRCDSHARVVASGVDDGTAQRLRNVLGTHPIAALRAKHRLPRPNLGQILGIGWLAWWLLDE